jgi:CheY-like chemotaxis protein
MERRQIPRPQRILIAEDSDDIRLMWKAWLTFWGFTVDEARNGAEAVRMCQAHKPDLVLMDLWMPIMDGLSATIQLQSDAATSDVPVLALSASGLPSTAERAKAAGCAAFVAKPVEPDELIEHLRKAFARMRDAGSTN